jgi:Holliday junction resolvasome RuvABC endonuclease subunit
MVLEDYGMIPQIHEPEGRYPSNYVIWAHNVFCEIRKIIDRFTPDVLVIEETSKGSKNAMSQKVLEFTHFLLASFIKDGNIESKYLMTEEWRREIGCVMTDAEKKKNKSVRTYKKEFEKKNGKKTTIAYDIDGKRIGLTGRKHVNVRRANEIFGGQLKKPLILQNEDQADALGLVACYHMRRLKPKKAQEVSLEDILKGNV